MSDCIDAALLPHTLEFAPDPYAILREADRVLVGEGQLLLLGFRPWSLWGMRARWSRARLSAGHAPRAVERLVREWLVLLGYEVVAEQRYLYLGPWSRGLAASEGTGRMLRAGPHLSAACRRLPPQGAQARLHPDTDPAACAREGRP